MIISRTPLRISFVGGGSDIPSFYEKQPGAVISTTINKYIYITINDNFDNNIRAKYSKTEVVEKYDNLRHPLIRECLKIAGIDSYIEITSLADIPSRGMGLGSSSSFTVGLLNALFAYKGKILDKKILAELACKVEIDILKHPIGKQDQYAAAYGGLNLFKFHKNKVIIRPIKNTKLTNKLEENLLLMYTGKFRNANKILSKQKEDVEKDIKKFKNLQEMVKLTELLNKNFLIGDTQNFGDILEKNWLLKKKLSKGISNKKFDSWYEIAKKYGANGGKILGAGGGGFLLLFSLKKNHNQIIKHLPKLKNCDFKFENEGSKIIYSDK